MRMASGERPVWGGGGETHLIDEVPARPEEIAREAESVGAQDGDRVIARLKDSSAGVEAIVNAFEQRLAGFEAEVRHVQRRSDIYA